MRSNPLKRWPKDLETGRTTSRKKRENTSFVPGGAYDEAGVPDVCGAFAARDFDAVEKAVVRVTAARDTAGNFGGDLFRGGAEYSFDRFEDNDVGGGPLRRWLRRCIDVGR